LAVAVDDQRRRGAEALRHPTFGSAYRRRRVVLQFLALLLLVFLTTLILKFLFSFGKYNPNFYEPKDIERENDASKKK